MFFADPVAAFANIGRALRPGGRLAFVCPADARLNGWAAVMASLRGLLPVGDFGRAGLPGMFSWPPGPRPRDPHRGRFHPHRRRAGAGRRGVGTGAKDAAEFPLDTGPGRHLLEQAGAGARTPRAGHP